MRAAAACVFVIEPGTLRRRKDSAVRKDVRQVCKCSMLSKPKDGGFFHTFPILVFRTSNDLSNARNSLTGSNNVPVL